MPLPGLLSMTGPEKPGLDMAEAAVMNTPPGMTPPGFPTMPMGGAAMPKLGGGLPFSMPALGNLSKAPPGLPGGVGGLLAGTGMTLPTAPLSMEGAGPKVQSKAQFPGLSEGTIPKMQGL